MAIQIGDTIPDTNLSKMVDETPQSVNLVDLSKGETLALFSVPGAFTPTCSARHLPGFIDHFEDFKAKGVDKIACVSVNDAFVMDAWGKSQNADGKVLMLADGNGDFAAATGLELDGRGFGLGMRSKRYSMLIRDGKVVELNVEEGGEFKKSAAEYLLAQL